MRTTRKLIHIYLLGCHSLERMPPNISLLNNLRTLTTFIVGTKAGRGIEELKDLHHLTNMLELRNLGNINSRENGKKANLYQKKNLSEILLYWSHHIEYMPENKACNEEEVSESLTPHDKLKVLELHGYSGLKISGRMREPQKFLCVRVLHISYCSYKDLPAVELSFSLECLVLSGMDNLTTLCKSVGMEAQGCNIPLQFFPKLKYLKLKMLSNMEKWAENTTGEANYFVTFPELEMLEITKCQKLSSVPDCPVLKKLETEGCPSLAMSSLAHLTTLSELTYGAGESSCLNMWLGSWSSLVRLDVRLSNDIVTPVEIDKNQGPLENLRSFTLSGLSFFTATFPSSQMHARMWKCFTFVEELRIDCCNDLVRWPTEELMSLIHLRSLDIESCDNLEGKGSSSDDIPKFPISYCRRLVALPSNHGNLARLKVLYFTSLERLTIRSCPKIEKFPQGLLQRLATLKSLWIEECPVLQRRCREGGEYFELLSSIPRKYIAPIYIPEPEIEGTEEFAVKESMCNVKRLVKRFLPSC
ncbi:hypothetical protein ABZP36_029704 [Zizania latifolia]